MSIFYFSSLFINYWNESTPNSSSKEVYQSRKQELFVAIRFVYIYRFWIFHIQDHFMPLILIDHPLACRVTITISTQTVGVGPFLHEESSSRRLLLSISRLLLLLLFFPMRSNFQQGFSKPFHVGFLDSIIDQSSFCHFSSRAFGPEVK